jgi:SAM-dependent methyltransferase
MDTGLPQYVGTELVEHEYYLRFLPDTARLVVDCGGSDANASARWARLHPEADLVVVDMDEFALKKSALRGLANLTPLLSPIEALPLADQSVDVVFSTFVVEHLYDWELSDFYIEARRVLRPGGRLVIQSDASFFDKYIHPVLRLIKGQGWRTSEFLQRWDPSVHAVHHHNLKTGREQRAVIERHGFFVQGVDTPLLFSNRLGFAALYEAMTGVLPLAWIERFLATSYTIVGVKKTD